MKPWVVDAKEIGEVGELNPSEDLVITPTINEFIATAGREDMYFVVAPKGIGKTLFLMYKRYIYQKKHKKDLQEGEIYFIPKVEALDRTQQALPFSFEAIKALEKIEYWTNIWLLSISLSVIKNLKINYGEKKDREKEEELNKVIGSLPGEIRDMVNDPLLVTPFGYLTNILDRSHSSIIKIAKKQYRLTSILNRVRSGVAIFIDNVDEYFGEHLGQNGERSSVTGVLSSEMWYNAQIGLINAIWVLSGQSSHIKVFASIRKEAWERLLRNDPLGLQKKGSALDIEYTKLQLKGIFEKNIKRMNKKDLVNADFIIKDLIYAFLGLENNKIVIPRVGNQKDDIFDYIYRHTLKRPRDFMVIGKALTAICPNERTAENIRTVVNKEATTIALTYLAETKPFLEFIRPLDELFVLIDSDILSKREIKRICSTYNNQENCEERDCKKCNNNHVFCNLYKIGLLGCVDIDEGDGSIIQKFERPGDKIFETKILPVSDFYLIHPILNSVIRERKKMKEGASYYINPRTIVGDRRPWKDPRIYRADRYCGFINCVCSTDRFLNKRGVFLSSSASKKEFVEELGNKLKKLNLAVEPDKWTKSEETETGRIMCNEVCPKVFRNLWMLAEVSDFNPNVFFECGFALGLGRRVVFLCDDKSADIKAKLGEQLYKSYQTVDEIPNKLGWKTEKFNNIKINDLYQVPRDFEYIDNFDSPSDREKNNEVYVLSFNHETKVIKKLSDEYGYRIVELYRLNQDFMPGDLVEELINSQAVLVNLAGVQKGETLNKIQDSQLMCLAGICVSQGIPVKIFQSNRHFYSDVHKISTDSIEQLIDFVRASRV